MPDDKLGPDAKRLLELLNKGPTPHGYADQLQNFAVRRKWLTAAWLLGASYRQLATLHSVSHASILQAVNKEMDPDSRRAKRINASITFTAIVWYRDQFQLQVEVLRSMPPEAIAKWLLTNTPFTGD